MTPAELKKNLAAAEQIVDAALGELRDKRALVEEAERKHAAALRARDEARQALERSKPLGKRETAMLLLAAEGSCQVRYSNPPYGRTYGSTGKSREYTTAEKLAALGFATIGFPPPGSSWRQVTLTPEGRAKAATLRKEPTP